MISQAFKKIIKRIISPPLVERAARRGVYLTFDDGPHPKYTPRILDALMSCNARATFFMIGSEMERYPDIVASVLAQGHTVGLHSCRHRHLRQLSVVEVVRDFRCSIALARRFGFELRYYRPPYGELSILYILMCAWKGIGIVLWSKDSRDSFITGTEDLLDRLDTLGVEEGDILLFHDDTEVTADALPTYIGQLSSYGIQCVALGAE